VAYRMLGSLDEADDVVQQAWLRARHVDAADIENARGWLTTVVARLCLDRLRSRRRSGEVPLVAEVVPANARVDGPEPEDEAVLVESVGRALLVVLDRLSPAE